MRWLLLLLLIAATNLSFAQVIPAPFKVLEGLAGRQYIDSANALAYPLVVAQLSESQTIFTLALRYSSELGYKKGEAETQRWLAIVTYLQGQYEKSVAHNQAAIDLFRALGMKELEADQYATLGFQMKSRDLPRAERYMRQGMHLLEALQDSGRLTGVYDNYGVLKQMAQDLDSAGYFYGKAMTLKRIFNDSLGMPYSLNKIGDVYLQRGQTKAARAAFDEAYQIRVLRKDAFGIMENHATYGDYFLALEKPDSAIHWYTLAMTAGRANGYPFMVRYCFDRLSNAYELKGDLASALRYHRQYAAISDSLKNDQRARQVTELELKFETVEKERENSLLRQQQAEQQLAISRQRVWIVGLAGAAGVIALLGLFVVQRNRQRESAKRNAAILAERQKGLKAIISATEDERGRIAHDLHDGIVQSLTALSLQLQREKNVGDGLQKLILLLNESIAEVRNISHSMMPRALAEVGLAPAIADMLEKSLGSAGIPVSLNHNESPETRLDSTIEIGLYRIAQELVNNIIKHAKAGKVDVLLMQNATQVLLCVEDDGVGITTSQLNEARSGIGLASIRSRVSALGGEVSFVAGHAKGTVAMVRIPLITAATSTI